MNESPIWSVIYHRRVPVAAFASELDAAAYLEARPGWPCRISPAHFEYGQADGVYPTWSLIFNREKKIPVCAFPTPELAQDASQDYSVIEAHAVRFGPVEDTARRSVAWRVFAWVAIAAIVGVAIALVVQSFLAIQNPAP